MRLASAGGPGLSPHTKRRVPDNFCAQIGELRPMRPTLKEIKKYRTLIESEWQDEDGYWIALIPGYMDGTNPWCHTIQSTPWKPLTILLCLPRPAIALSSNQFRFVPYARGSTKDKGQEVETSSASCGSSRNFCLAVEHDSSLADECLFSGWPCQAPC